MAFETGSLLHFSCLAVCALMAWSVVVAARWFDGRAGGGDVVRKVVGYACIGVWLMNSAYHLVPENFSWEDSLPLHFCNFANLLGAAALLGRRRVFQSLLYFWTLGLSIWAFLTPTVTEGPDDFGFWVFWIYHAFIVVSLVFVLFIDRFRPRLPDLKHAVVITAAYAAILIAIDYAFRWNYGFLGPSSPSQPTPIDVLGPYPYRVVYLVLGVTVIFSLLYLPWRFAIARGAGADDRTPPD